MLHSFVSPCVTLHTEALALPLLWHWPLLPVALAPHPCATGPSSLCHWPLLPVALAPPPLWHWPLLPCDTGPTPTHAGSVAPTLQAISTSGPNATQLKSALQLEVDENTPSKYSRLVCSHGDEVGIATGFPIRVSTLFTTAFLMT